MGAINAVRHIELDPARAWALWTDVRRWPAFIEGFRRAVERTPEWPAEGARLVWTSTRGGRGQVSEQVTEAERGAVFATAVAEDALSGTQRVTFEHAADGRTRVELRLDYRLASHGPLRAVADVLFIRRALGQALERTLARFASEAADETAR